MGMMQLKSLIAYNIKVQLEKHGYPRTPADIGKLSRADDELLQAALKLIRQLENDARFSTVLATFHTFGINRDSFLVVLDELLVGEMNWARIMSIVAISGALAVMCMENGEDFKTDLIQDWTVSFTEVKLKKWMDNNNGMVNMNQASIWVCVCVGGGGGGVRTSLII